MENKEIVRYFYERVFNNGDLSEIDKLMRDDYKQHSPGVADGKAGFLGFINDFLKKGPHAEIVKLLQDEDMVCVFFRCTFNNGVVAKVFDMYRLQDGQLAEHWDCTMRVDDMECKHPNGQF
ncbi:MAG: nuclear transport factor 2 family protein [Eubacteriales bacterium]|nr:nuclear transport factor 2 family protein [Eubacteriales bacterium]